MDLAKIRKKSSSAVMQPISRQVDASSTEAANIPGTPVLTECIADSIEHVSLEVTPVPSSNTPSYPLESEQWEKLFDPVAVLLAGRQAAGCDEDIQLTTVELVPAVKNNYEQFLCFHVSNETYGINIMQIKEIIKPRTVTEVPRAPSFVSGVISLRGVIIPVIDMLNRLGLNREKVTGKERIVVVKTGDAYTGLVVDEVVQVVRIPTDAFEPAPAVLEGIDRDFVTGIGRAEHRMVILLNVESITDINLY
ncbi:chemotaxis protein CheW [Pelotalea chapellei]|uniref:Chemotaxis protein CheW n=1 Tax=Pelotalea chapellei TaxID=44671 RepID=A0ABS5U7L3_9BACT|nr:chemotaxis protein CheW [Pelotalea chapellei]MBT1071649.1 chemotaxis protein CheW [Pelotalea chapellei]